MSYSALAVDLASVLDSLANGRAGDEMFRVARLVIDGYERVTPLETDRARADGRVLGGPGRGHVAIGLAGGAWPGGCRVRRALHRARPRRSMRPSSTTGWDEAARRLGAPRRPAPGAAG